MLTDTHRHNLTRLATYLEQLPADYTHFKMHAFLAEDDNELEVHEAEASRINQCGACACAVGHAPVAGIQPKFRETWTSYQLRVFGMNQLSSYEPSGAWDYMFGAENPDDHLAAAARIRAFLANDCNVPA